MLWRERAQYINVSAFDGAAFHFKLSSLHLRQWPAAYLMPLPDWPMSCQPGHHMVFIVSEWKWKQRWVTYNLFNEISLRNSTYLTQAWSFINILRPRIVAPTYRSDWAQVRRLYSTNRARPNIRICLFRPENSSVKFPYSKLHNQAKDESHLQGLPYMYTFINSCPPPKIHPFKVTSLLLAMLSCFNLEQKGITLWGIRVMQFSEAKY